MSPASFTLFFEKLAADPSFKLCQKSGFIFNKNVFYEPGYVQQTGANPSNQSNPSNVSMDLTQVWHNCYSINEGKYQTIFKKKIATLN